MKLILASKSGVRKKILDDNGIDSDVIVSNVDEEEVKLKPYDVVVQRRTNHAWVNHGTEPALLIAVLIDSSLV